EGTNSKDRRIGAEGLLKALLNQSAIGVVTTHDLALTEITGSANGLVRNMHFADQVKDGKMYFDYRLREGIIAKSNALELMRLLGFEIKPAPARKKKMAMLQGRTGRISAEGCALS